MQDFTDGIDWIIRKRLEMLNISHNRVDNMEGLSTLQALIALNAGKRRNRVVRYS